MIRTMFNPRGAMLTFSALLAACLMALFAATLLTGCGSSGSSERDTTLNSGTLASELEACGVSVSSYDQEAHYEFSVVGKGLRLNSDTVFVFEYSDADAAAADAALVHKDGFGIANTQIHWASIPHFYQKGRIILSYCGQDPTVLTALEEVLGQQFAGG